jgi:phosphoketolase
MDDKEMAAIFTGYGYQPRVVDDLNDIDADLNNSMEWAIAEIKRIQNAARNGKPIMKPRWPVLILRTPKGWSGPKKVHGEIIEGSFHAHQVPLPASKTDPEELKDLQKWLQSYKPEELFKEDGDIIDEIKSIIPEKSERRLGQKRESCAGHQPLKATDWKPFTVKAGSSASSMKTVGNFLEQVVKDNPTTFRIFSPDEFESNSRFLAISIWLHFTNTSRTCCCLELHGTQLSMGSVLQCQRWKADRDSLRTSMSGVHARIYSHRPHCPLPILRSVSWHRAFDDGSVCKIWQDGAGDQVASAHQQH